MKEKNYIILMADIIGSSSYSQKQLFNDFNTLIGEINKDYPDRFLSPMTITLGDEFQSILKDLSSALTTIFDIEEKLIKMNKNFKFRYVLVEGKIDTPINPEIAYGMMGPGLTIARALLNSEKKSRHRFNIEINDLKLNNALNNAYIVAQSFLDHWKCAKDYQIISEFLAFKDYKLVANELSKDRSLIWKRARTLRIEAYFSIKELIHHLGEVS